MNDKLIEIATPNINKLVEITTSLGNDGVKFDDRNMVYRGFLMRAMMYIPSDTDITKYGHEVRVVVDSGKSSLKETPAAVLLDKKKTTSSANKGKEMNVKTDNSSKK